MASQSASAACLDETVLGDFLEGRLSDEALGRVDAHLDRCARCREVLVVLRSTASGGATPSATAAAARAQRRGGGGILRVGEVVAGRYEIVRLLGRGGMGEVYEALDRELGSEPGSESRSAIALKTWTALAVSLPDGDRAVANAASAEARLMARLRRELQIARRVTHPNVCRVFDVERDGELMFLTMELLRGETLGRRIARTGALSLDEAASIARELCAGLQAAHAAGVVHRDLKSENVILVEEGGRRAVLTDFGLARASDLPSMSSEGALVGTLAYMAPEQVSGGRATPAADVYALGVVLFEIVTGRLPFQSDTPLATALARLERKAPDARTLVPSLPASWATAIARCLERDPAARFASAAELARALTDGSGGRPARTRRFVAAGALIGALITTGASAVIVRGLRREDPSRVAPVVVASPAVAPPAVAPPAVAPPTIVPTAVAAPVASPPAPVAAPVAAPVTRTAQPAKSSSRRAKPDGPTLFAPSWGDKVVPLDDLSKRPAPPSTQTQTQTPVAPKPAAREPAPGDDDPSGEGLINPYSPATRP